MPLHWNKAIRGPGGGRLLRPLAALLALVAVAALLFGCGGETAAPEAVTATPAVELGVEQELVLSGGQLRTYLPKAADSLNPLLNNSEEMSSLLSLCYEKLIDCDGSVALSPSLAESWTWEESSPDGLVWIISLRKNVNWHDGEPFSSRDVLYTFNLLRSPAYADSPYAARLDAVADCLAVDDYTIRVTGKQPGMMALYAMTFPVLPAHAFSAGEEAVGTGPYRLSYAAGDEGLLFEANQAWWRSAPLIQEVRVLRTLDNAEALRSLSDDTLNFVLTNSVTSSGYREEGRVNVAEISSLQCELMLVNHNNVLLQDVNVRKAIAYGLDRRDIITKAYLGHAFAIDVPVPPHSWLYDSDSKIYDYNLNQARSLLQASGWQDLDGDGIVEKIEGGNSLRKLTLRLLVNDTPEDTKRKDAANLIQTCLAEVGIQVEVLTAPWTNSRNDYLTVLQSGGFDLALAGFYMDVCPDLSPYISSTGANNYGNYRSASMDSLLQNVVSAPDEGALQAAMEEVQDYFVEELPLIPLYFRTSSILFSDMLSLSSAAQLTEDSPFRGVERWYFDSQGLQSFPAGGVFQSANWSHFDRVTPEARLRAAEAGEGASEEAEGEDGETNEESGEDGEQD